MTTFTSLKDQVESLYMGYLDRTDSGPGTSYWVNQIESGAMTFAKVAESFAVQPEALAKYSYLSAPTVNTPTDFINQVYQQLFDHTADVAGLAYWTAQLTAAQGNPQAIGQFIVNVISGATGADDATVTNKLDMVQAVAPKTPDIGLTSAAGFTAGLSPVDRTLVSSGTDQIFIAGTEVVELSASGFNTGAAAITLAAFPEFVYSGTDLVQVGGMRFVDLDVMGVSDFTAFDG